MSGEILLEKKSMWGMGKHDKISRKRKRTQRKRTEKARIIPEFLIMISESAREMLVHYFHLKS